MVDVDPRRSPTSGRPPPAQVALAWLRYRADALGVAAVPIPGTRRAARVEENLGSLDGGADARPTRGARRRGSRGVRAIGSATSAGCRPGANKRANAPGRGGVPVYLGP